jgi:hypothetical protein
MADTYRSEKKNIGELLAGRIKLSRNQRQFSWDSSQIETFWQDVQWFSNENSGDTYRGKEYFLGSIVVIEPPGALEKEILDGQQRLATTTILLSVVRDILRELGFNDAATTLQDRYISSHDDLRDADYNHLQLSRYDQDFFARQIQQPRGSTFVEPPLRLKSHDLIRKARNYFHSFIAQTISSLPSTNDKKRWLLRLNEIVLGSVTVIQVSSSDRDKAGLVFETLNDRGIGLSTPDLLRNFMLDEAASDEDREQISLNWEDVLELEENTHSEDFIRHFWLSRYGDVKTRSLYREIKDRVLREEIPVMRLSRELSDEAEIYEAIVTADDDDPEIQRQLKGISLLGANAVLPAALSAFVVGNSDQQKQLLRALVILYIRHTIVGGLENAKLEQLVFRIAREVRNTRDFAAAISAIRSFSPSDQDFLENLKTVRISRSGAARFILREIEMAKRPSASEVSVEDVPLVNLEHIYPKNPSFGSLPNHEEVVDRLGNMTLLRQRLNAAAKSGTFASKKPFYQNSDLLITNELSSLENFGVPEVEARQAAFAEFAGGIWRY